MTTQQDKLRMRLAAVQATAAVIISAYDGVETLGRVTMNPDDPAQLGLISQLENGDPLMSPEWIKQRLVIALAVVAAGKREGLILTNAADQASRFACSYIDAGGEKLGDDEHTERGCELVGECIALAESLTSQHADSIEKVKTALLERGTLMGADVRKLVPHLTKSPAQHAV